MQDHAIAPETHHDVDDVRDAVPIPLTDTRTDGRCGVGGRGGGAGEGEGRCGGLCDREKEGRGGWQWRGGSPLRLGAQEGRLVRRGCVDQGLIR